MTDYQQTKYYFAQHDDSNKIYPEIGPKNVPGTDDEWTSVNKKCLGGEDAYGNYTPGNVRTFVGGMGAGAQTMTLEFVWMSTEKISSLCTLRDLLEQFIFCDGTVKWLCVWEGNRPIDLKGIEGCKTGYGVTINLRVQGVYS